MIEGGRHACLVLASVVAWTAFAVAGASAQMMLPGAMNGNAPSSSSSSGSTGGGGGTSSGGSSSAPSTYAPPKPVVIKPPDADTVVGHTLAFDGLRGAMSFEKDGDAIKVAKLTLTGDKISKPGEACSVDVATGDALAAAPAGRPVGALRFTIPVKACPLTVDVLDGAVLVTAANESCDFTAADCRVAPGGLWGPHAADITSKQAKDLERQRVRFETTMRANFRALLRKAGKDREAVKAIAKDQAAFSSDREMICRDYEQESTHGFCSTQITQARVLALLAKFADSPEAAKEHRRMPHPKPKPRSAKAPASAPPDPAGAPDPTSN